MRYQRWAPAALAVVALALAACGSSSSGSSGSSAPASTPSAAQAASGQTAMLKSAKTSLGTVLTDSKGMTVYWFAIDTPTASKCSGTCATYWPPVTGTPQASGLSGKFGTIKRSDGTLQATWNGHPLYTYAGDKSPGQTTGNKLNASGGLWYAVTLSKASGGGGASSPAPKASSSSGGAGGSGY
jgi:predicted lipoprotein with Yx(FWY)xxD motif